MIKTTRKVQFNSKVLIIDGLPGCGKTMLSPIVSTLNRVEKLTYAFEIELMCQLWDLGKLDGETAQTMVRTFTDMKLYYTMMSRDVNFRWGDLSSVFMDGQPWRYVRRVFGPGDETVPSRVDKERPILHLTTHHLLGMGRPIFEALGGRLLFVDVVRHPLYMVKQQSLNIEKLIGDVRYSALHFEYKGKELPGWTRGWEDVFMRSNAVERAVHSIIWMSQRAQENKKALGFVYGENILTVPFESFVIDPWPYMETMTKKLETTVTPLTHRMMRRQHVPRQKIASGIDLPIYRRCGWQPSKANADERQEFADRRNWAAQRVSPQVLELLDYCCRIYEEMHMGGLQDIPEEIKERRSMNAGSYFSDFNDVLKVCLDDPAHLKGLDDAVVMLKATKNKKQKIVLVGNGGSSAIAEHMAIDLTKNAGLKAMAFSGSPMLTTFANDFGYEKIFQKAIAVFAEGGDVLIAISSGGSSPNILNAVSAAKLKGMKIITFSGFAADNPLRRQGDINFWVDSSAFGYVELVHNLLLHYINDAIIGKAEYMIR